MKTPMRTKRAYALRRKKPHVMNPLLSGGEFPNREFRCARCSTRFPDYLARCPECGSTEWEELAEVNPYTRLPMESFLKGCGHMFWILGTIGSLVLLWQTDTPDWDRSILFVYGAIVSVAGGVLFSAFFFALSEMLRRILRMQRRLRAFHDTYRMTRALLFAGKVRKFRKHGRPSGHKVSA